MKKLMQFSVTHYMKFIGFKFLIAIDLRHCHITERFFYKHITCILVKQEIFMLNLIPG